MLTADQVGRSTTRAVASPPGSGAHIGFALLAALTGLALLEHWLMVVSLQDARLWRWLMPRPEERASHRISEPRTRLSEDAHGL